MNEDRFRRGVVLLLVVLISAVFVAMIRGFLMTILLAAIFSGLVQPLFSRFCALFRARRALAAVVTLLVVLVIVVGPLLGFFGVVASEAFRISQTVGPWIERQISEPDQMASLVDKIPGMDRLQPYRAQILTRLGELVGAIGNFLFDSLQATTRGTITFFFHFSLMLYTMFFFLLDGERILRKILYYIPLSNEDEARMVGKFVAVTKATLKGTLVIGIIQGALGGCALAVAGIPGAVFWGTVMVLLSVIPGIGTALVWGPAAIYLGVSGHTTSAILLAIFCAVGVGSVDNILRPRLVGRDVKMHDLLILFGTMGGIFFFGVLGFIIGPILAALFVTIWDIYGVVFREALPSVEPPRRSDV